MIATLMVCILLVALSGYLFWNKIYNLIIDNLANKYTKSNVLYQKERICGIINRELAISQLMSGSKIMKLWAKNENDMFYRDIATQEFDNYRKKFTSKSAFFVIHESLNYYYADENSKEVKIIKTLKKDRKDDLWYFITTEQGQLYTLNVDFDKEVGKTNLWINVVMLDDGILRGVIGTGIEITDFIRDFIERSENDAKSFILHEDGAIFAAKDKSLLNMRIIDKAQRQTKIQDLTNPENSKQLDMKLKNILTNTDKIDVFRIKFDDGEYTAAIAYIPELKWIVLSAISIDKIINIRDLLIPIIIVFIVVVLVFVSFGLLVQRMIIKPIGRISASTNNIKEGKYDTNIIYSYNDEIGELCSLFNIMTNKIKEHIENLENKVAERTKELAISKDKISTLLDSSGEGFLKFGKDFKVDNEYSTICNSIFGQDIAGKDIIELLFDDKNKIQNVKNIFKAIFNQENLFLKETMLELLPTEVEILDKNYRLTYKFDKDMNIILIMKDITDEKRLEAQLENEKKMLSFVVEYIKDEFVTKELIKDFEDFVKNIDNYNLSSLKKELHTFKGNFLQKGFVHLPEMLHKVEENLNNLLLDKKGLQELMMSSLKKDLDVLTKYLDESFTSGNYLRILEFDLKRIADNLKNKGDSLYSEIMDLLKIDITHFLENFRKVVDRVSETEGKLVCVSVKCDERIKLYIPYYFKMLNSFYHIITNAVVHGIELPSVREAKGKPEFGQITIKVYIDNGFLNFVFYDDGKGIPEENLEKIFEEGYTSVQESDILKGRGVGLSAVKYEVEKLNGEIKVVSQVDVGTEIHIKIPLEE